MLGVFTVLMVLFDDLIEELGEAGVGIVGTSIASDSRVKVLNSREDASFESNSGAIFLILELVPKSLGKVS